MRLFAAIDLDDAARAGIVALQKRIATELSMDRSIKWVNASHMHVTLLFLGEVAESAAPGLADAFSADIDVKPFRAVFAGLGVFPPRRDPRSLWLGVTEGVSQIVEVHRRVASRLALRGAALEARPFHPHLTLARWRDSRPADRDRALAADPRAPIALAVVGHVTLYHSQLSSAGPTYTALARATLT